MSGEPDPEEWMVYREVWAIVERRDGAVYRTEFVGHDWVPMGSHGDGQDLIWAVPRDGKNPRRRKDTKDL